jgi:hypothetical protein
MRQHEEMLDLARRSYAKYLEGPIPGNGPYATMIPWDGTLFNSRTTNHMHGNDPNSTCFCGLGAIESASGVAVYDFPGHLAGMLRDYMRSLLSWDYANPQYYLLEDDAPPTEITHLTVDGIKKLFEETIASLEAMTEPKLTAF